MKFLRFLPLLIPLGVMIACEEGPGRVSPPAGNQYLITNTTTIVFTVTNSIPVETFAMQHITNRNEVEIISINRLDMVEVEEGYHWVSAYNYEVTFGLKDSI
jgi:hypothetical protein